MNPLDICNQLQKQKLTGDLFFESSYSKNISFENNHYKGTQVRETSGYGLRILNAEKKEGFSCVNQLSPDFVASTLSLCQYSEIVDYSFPAITQLITAKSYSDSFLKQADSFYLEQARNLIDTLLRKHPDLTVNVDISLGKYHSRLLNTSAADLTYTQPQCSYSLSALRAGNNEMLEIYDFYSAHTPPVSPENLAETILMRLEWAKQKAVLTSGSYPVLFTPKALRSFLDILLTGFNGKHIEKGVSPILAYQGKKLGSSAFSVLDDYQHPDLTASRPYDDEGVPTQNKYFIEKGVIGEGYFDLKTAAKLQKASTGNAARGYSGLPYPAPGNIIVTPGERSFDELLSFIPKGILVDQLLGAGQSNVMAGEFSANIDLGYAIENGEITGRVKDTMLSGNVFELIGQISGISREQIAYGRNLLPYILFDGFKVST